MVQKSGIQCYNCKEFGHVARECQKPKWAKDAAYHREKMLLRNLKLLINFVEKFLGTVKFRNDQIAPILGHGDLVQGAVMIKRVYYVEGLNHNLFSVGQFCDANLEVAFRKSTCFIRDLKGKDLLSGNIVSSMVMASSSVLFELRHHQLAVKDDIVVGLPK
nr:integrase, catalytic region, zinc finger, CCHC-type, peptidase aspartic, catalytic [Tanacetum cinerariifolium]